MADIKYDIDISDVVRARKEIKRWSKTNTDSIDVVNSRMRTMGKTSEVAFNQYGRAASRAQQKSKRFASVGLQQVGYQVGDFAVQVQSGTNAFVAFGQQASQLVGILGPYGAVAGAVIAIGSALANVWYQTSQVTKETEKATEATKVFGDAAKNANSKIADLSAQLKVLKGGYEDVTEAALDSAVKQAEAALKAAKAQTVQQMGAFGAMGGGQETIDRQVAAAEKELELAQQKLDNYQRLIAEEERLSQKSEETNQERILGEQMLQKEREDALAQFQADLAATAKTLDEVFKSRTLFYSIRFAGEEDVMSQAVKPAGGKLDPGMSYEQLLALGVTPDALASMGMKIPSKFKPKMRPMDLGAGDSKRGGGGGVDPVEEFNRARDALAGLVAQYDEGVAVAEELRNAQIIVNDAVKAGVITTEQGQTAMQGYIQSLEQADSPLKQIGQTLKDSLGDAFMSIVDGSKSAGDAFRDMARLVLKQAFELLVIKPILDGLFGGSGGGGTGILGKIFGFANGGAFMNGKVTAFANGGVVNGPTVFPMANGMGLMGEAGPEAVMPLKRGKNGKLGVQVEGSQGNVTVENHFHIAANGDDSVKRIIAQEAPRIANLTQKQILDQRRRGGVMKSTFG